MKPMTYKDNQPGNVDAWRLGEACRSAAADPKCGDPIDRGLILLRELEAKGYGVVKLAQSVGYCAEGERCVCGGDTPGVRAGCANWKTPNV